jgi:hypothetical protein
LEKEEWTGVLDVDSLDLLYLFVPLENTSMLLACTHALARTCTHKCSTRTNSHKRTSTRTHTCTVLTYTHTRTHTRLHTHTCAHIGAAHQPGSKGSNGGFAQAPDFLQHQLHELRLRQQQQQPRQSGVQKSDGRSREEWRGQARAPGVGNKGRWAMSANQSSPIPPASPIESIWSMPDLFSGSASMREFHAGHHAFER